MFGNYLKEIVTGDNLRFIIINSIFKSIFSKLQVNHSVLVNL